MTEALIVFIIAITIRLLAVRHTIIGFDTYGHLYFAKEVKEQKAGPFGEITMKVAGAAGFRQPFLWHWLVGFFNIETVLRYQKWFNPILDSIFVLVIYLTVLQLGYSKNLAFLTAILYLLTPMWFSRLSIGPRINNFTPRLASELGVNLFFMVAMLPLGLPDWLVLIIATLLSAFVLLSSKFGLQVLLFLAPLTALIDLNPILLVAAGTSFLFALIVTKGQFLKSANQQLNHLIWYFKKNLKGKMAISDRNRWSKLSENLHTKKGIFQKFKSLIANMLSLNSYTSVLLKMPVLTALFLLAGFLVFNGDGGTTYMAPVIAAFVVYMLINWPPLLFLGEAERYLSHVAFFIVFACVIVANQLNAEWIIWLLITYGFFYWIAESFFLHRWLPNDPEDMELAKQEFTQFLNSRGKPGTVLSYPYHAGGGVYRIMMETQHKVIFSFGISPEFQEVFEKKYALDYPYVKLDSLDEMADELGVDILVTDRQTLDQRGHIDWSPSQRWESVNIGDDKMLVYQLVKVK